MAARLTRGHTSTLAGRSGEGSSTMTPDIAITDETLMLRVRDRDADALALLYDRHHRAAYSLAYRVLNDAGHAEDVVQESFLAVWRYAGRFEPSRGQLRAWLLTIVRRRAINHLRGKLSPGQLAELDERQPDLQQPEVWQQAYDAIRQTDIQAALQQLPQEQRLAIELAFFNGLSHSEIAARLGVPLGTVKSRIRLAFRKLRAVLEQYAGRPASAAHDDPRPALSWPVRRRDVRLPQRERPCPMRRRSTGDLGVA
jgi:RNA polymerase sigma-70 factor (ECF subfamily)